MLYTYLRLYVFERLIVVYSNFILARERLYVELLIVTDCCIQQYYIDGFKLLSAVAGIVGVGATFTTRNMDRNVKQPLESKIDTLSLLVSRVQEDQTSMKMDMKDDKKELKDELKEIKVDIKEMKMEMKEIHSILVELRASKKH